LPQTKAGQEKDDLSSSYRQALLALIIPLARSLRSNEVAERIHPRRIGIIFWHGSVWPTRRLTWLLLSVSQEKGGPFLEAGIRQQSS
jgi:hypothetical protein